MIILLLILQAELFHRRNFHDKQHPHVSGTQFFPDLNPAVRGHAAQPRGRALDAGVGFLDVGVARGGCLLHDGVAVFGRVGDSDPVHVLRRLDILWEPYIYDVYNTLYSLDPPLFALHMLKVHATTLKGLKSNLTLPTLGVSHLSGSRRRFDLSY